MLRRTSVTTMVAVCMVGLSTSAAAAAETSLTVKSATFLDSTRVTANGTITCPAGDLYRVDGTLTLSRGGSTVTANGSDDDRLCAGQPQPFTLDLFASEDTGLRRGHASLALSVYVYDCSSGICELAEQVDYRHPVRVS
jgi:hypothetical protein